MHEDFEYEKKRIIRLVSNGYCLLRLSPTGFGIRGYGGWIGRWSEELIQKLVIDGILTPKFDLAEAAYTKQIREYEE